MAMRACLRQLCDNLSKLRRQQHLLNTQPRRRVVAGLQMNDSLHLHHDDLMTTLHAIQKQCHDVNKWMPLA
jgi:hypothetical protein